jgi:hypothetical protein
MRIALLIPILLLTGCLTTAPVMPKFPEVPKELLESCPDLKTLDSDNQKLSTVLEVVAENYSQYYDCKSKIDDWKTWYTGQKKLWESVK